MGIFNFLFKKISKDKQKPVKLTLYMEAGPKYSVGILQAYSKLLLSIL